MLLASAWLFIVVGSVEPETAARPLMIDGGSIYPTEQSVSYNFRCPDGMVTMEVAQKSGGYPVVMKMRYGGLAFAVTEVARINLALKQIRTVASVAPRCFTGGGMQMLLGGVKRRPATDQRTVITVNINATGRIEIH